jgi:hypothetical protein
MTAQRVRIKLHVSLQSGLHIAGPGRIVALVDRPIELDPAGYPLIPASSMRGRLRTHLERLLRAWGEPVCTPPAPERMCPQIAFTPAPQDGYCLACRLFGSPWRDAALVSDDLRLVDHQRALSSELMRSGRTSLAIGRRLGVAQADRLFSMETTARALDEEPLRFEGYLHGQLTRTETGWLLAAAQLITHVGGGKARGAGHLTVSIAGVEWWQEQRWMAEPVVNKLIEEALGEHHG